MRRAQRGWLVGLVLVAAALAGAVGCSSGNPGPEPRLPARPTDLRLDGLDPCALLTPAQADQLGVSAAGGPEADTDQGSVGCQWDNFPREPDTSYLNRLILKRGADATLGSATGARVVILDGYAAVETTSPNVDPKEHCLLLVDVAQGESLWVQWMTLSHGYPGLSQELACQKAEGAGRLMLANLRTLAR